MSIEQLDTIEGAVDFNIKERLKAELVPYGEQGYPEKARELTGRTLADIWPGEGGKIPSIYHEDIEVSFNVGDVNFYARGVSVERDVSVFCPMDEQSQENKTITMPLSRIISTSRRGIVLLVGEVNSSHILEELRAPSFAVQVREIGDLEFMAFKPAAKPDII